MLTNIKIIITPEILKLIAEIDEFKGRWDALNKLSPARLDSLKKVATIESIGSSTRIEGVKLTDQEIADLLSKLSIKSFRSRDEEEVAGYAEAINLVFDSYNNIPLSENYIKQLHSILLKFSSKDTRHKGEYKKFPNNVVAFDFNGKEIGTIFETTSPFDTPEMIKQLIGWTNAQFNEAEYHPLLLVAVFVVCFLAIHPFQDGNGRLSRILTDLLLLKNGYVYVPYSSLEHVIEENKDNYYLALRKSQSTLKTDDINLEDWIIFFLRCLQKQKDILLNKVSKEALLLNLSAASVKILELVKEHGKMTISELLTLTDINRNTLKLRLRELVDGQYLEQQGVKKNTWYTVKSW